MEQLSSRRILTLLLIGLIAAMLPLITSEALLPQVTHIVVLAGAAMSLNLVIGNAGLVSMGHGLFLGLGAYVVAIANIKYGVPFGKAVVLALVVSVPVAAIAGFIALRAKALFFALLTLALGQVAFVFVARNYALTGGDDGLVGLVVPAWLESDLSHHLFAVGVTTALCLFLVVLLASPFGATVRAVRDNRERVASLGGNPRLYELAAFVIAGFLGAVMGVVAIATQGTVEPTVLSWTTSATLLVMVALGGRSTFLGPIVGAVILELSRAYIQVHSSHADLVVGALVIICAISFPEGVSPPIRNFVAGLFGRRKIDPTLPAAPVTATES